MNRLATAATAIFLVAVCPAQLLAGIQIGDQIKLIDDVGFPGGIFTVDVVSNLFEPSFKTFCVEISEDVDFVQTYVVDDISTSTVLGGKSLSSKTAWLYDQFLSGSLSSFNPLLQNDVDALQLAIWLSVGYTTADIPPGWIARVDPVLLSKTWELDFNFAVTNNLWSGIGNVRIMNLKTLSGQPAQDQLVIVPEPLSVLVWSLAIVCIGGAWKFKAAAASRAA